MFKNLKRNVRKRWRKRNKMLSSLRSITGEDLPHCLGRVLVQVGKHELSRLLDIDLDCLEEGKKLKVSHLKVRQLSNEGILKCYDKSSKSNQKKTNHFKAVSSSLSSPSSNSECSTNIGNKGISDSRSYDNSVEHKQTPDNTYISDFSSDKSHGTDNSSTNSKKHSRKRHTTSVVPSPNSCGSDNVPTRSQENAQKINNACKEFEYLSSRECKKRKTAESATEEKDFPSDNIVEESKLSTVVSAKRKSLRRTCTENKADNKPKNGNRSKEISNIRQSKRQVNMKSSSQKLQSGKESGLHLNADKPSESAINSKFLENSVLVKNTECKNSSAQSEDGNELENTVIKDHTKNPLNDIEPVNSDNRSKKKENKGNSKGQTSLQSQKRVNRACLSQKETAAEPVIRTPTSDVRDNLTQSDDFNKEGKDLQKGSKLGRKEKNRACSSSASISNLSPEIQIFSNKTEQVAFVANGNDELSCENVESISSVLAETKSTTCDKSIDSDANSAKWTSSNNNDVNKESSAENEITTEPDPSDSDYLLISLSENRLNNKLQKHSLGLDGGILSPEKHSVDKENVIGQVVSSGKRHVTTVVPSTNDRELNSVPTKFQNNKQKVKSICERLELRFCVADSTTEVTDSLSEMVVEESQLSTVVNAKRRSLRGTCNGSKTEDKPSNGKCSKEISNIRQSKRKVSAKSSFEKLQSGKKSGLHHDAKKPAKDTVNSEIENPHVVKNSRYEKPISQSEDGNELESTVTKEHTKNSLNNTEQLNSDGGLKKNEKKGQKFSQSHSRVNTACFSHEVTTSEPVTRSPSSDIRDSVQQSDDFSKADEGLQERSKLDKQEKSRACSLSKIVSNLSPEKQMLSNKAEQLALVANVNDATPNETCGETIEPNSPVVVETKHSCSLDGGDKSDINSAKWTSSNNDDSVDNESSIKYDIATEPDLSDSEYLLISSHSENELNYELQKQSPHLDDDTISPLLHTADQEMVIDHLSTDETSDSRYEKLKEQFQRAGLNLDKVVQSIDEQKLRELVNKAGNDAGMLLRFPHFCPFSKKQVGQCLIILNSRTEYIKAKEKNTSIEAP